MFKKIMIALTAVALFLCGGVVFSQSTQRTLQAHYPDITIYLDDQVVTPKDANGNVVEPFIVDGTTYLPVRAVAGALGCEVGWIEETSSVYLWSQDYAVTSDPEYGPIFTDIFDYAEETEMLCYRMISSGGTQTYELLFDYFNSDEVVIYGNAFKNGVNVGNLEKQVSTVDGDRVTYSVYYTRTEGEPDGWLAIRLLPNGYLSVSQHGDIGMSSDVDFTGEYGFVGMG